MKNLFHKVEVVILYLLSSLQLRVFFSTIFYKTSINYQKYLFEVWQAYCFSNELFYDGIKGNLLTPSFAEDSYLNRL